LVPDLIVAFVSCWNLLCFFEGGSFSEIQQSPTHFWVRSIRWCQYGQTKSSGNHKESSFRSLDSKNHIGACRYMYHPKQTLIIFVLDPSQIDYRFGRGSIRRFQSMIHGARFNLKWQEPILLVMNCPPQAEIFYLYVAKIHKIKGFSNDFEHKYRKNPRLRRAFL